MSAFCSRKLCELAPYNGERQKDGYAHNIFMINMPDINTFNKRTFPMFTLNHHVIE